MENKTLKFDHESLQDRNSVVTYLQALADGFKKGTLNLTDQHGEFSLEPDGLIHFRLRASNDDDHVRLSIRLSWHEPNNASKDDADAFTITAGKP